jgi:tetratricopeptide (TPR) repeat protein
VITVRVPFLVELFRQLPEDVAEAGEDTDRADDQFCLQSFRGSVLDRYSEGTLQRLLASGNAPTRRAAVLALGLVGTLQSNEALAARLRDDDPAVRRLAANALWSVWFRGGSDTQNHELRQIVHQRSLVRVLSGLNRLVLSAPGFAEALNQRAIAHFRLGEYRKAVADCEKVVELNPYHFGAQAGMAQCFLKLRQPLAALKAFRQALRINPNLDGVEATVRALEEALGEEGRKE